MGFRIQSKISVNLKVNQDDQELETLHVFNASKFDKQILKFSKFAPHNAEDDIQKQIVTEDKVSAMIDLYDNTIIEAQGYELEDGIFKAADHVPIFHKIAVIGELVKRRAVPKVPVKN